MKSGSNIILAIESAVCGGSLSLLSDGNEIANWIGSSNVSKAEDLLANIDTMLIENEISRHEISLIAVSAGPGSFTGIRIGIATSLGLKAGLGIEMSSESALKAMASSRPEHAKVTAALPVGRNAVCVQSFERTSGEVAALDEPYTLTEAEFLTLVHEQNGSHFILHSALFEKAGRNGSAIDAGTNLAYLIGIICSGKAGLITEPLFISKSF